MTVAKCTAACKAADAANILAGVEYGGECCKYLPRWMGRGWKVMSQIRREGLTVVFSKIDCGKKISNGAQPAPASKCNMVCNGNSTEYCGGGGALNVYNLGGTLPTR